MQTYSDYYGIGHNVGVTVTNSDTQSDLNLADHTLSGTGYLVDAIASSRFLGQATLGTDIEEITSLLINHNVMEETQVERLETFLERIGKSLWKSANEYDKAKIEERLNVPKKKVNRGKEK